MEKDKRAKDQTPEERTEQPVKLIQIGFIQRSRKLHENDGLVPVIGKCREQMLDKHLQVKSTFLSLPSRTELNDNLNIPDIFIKEIKVLDPHTGLGGRNFENHDIKSLEESHYEVE